MRRLARLAVAGAAVFAGGCATPVAPTGGPADTQSPTLVAASPADGAVRVAADRLTLTFSERLDPATAARAVRLSPQTDDATPPRVTVRGAEVEIELPPLRPATTYVVTVGTDLADARSVRLAAPVTLAFSTGDAVDAGRLAGVVRNPSSGRPTGGLAVWAYALPDSAASPPDPRTTAPDYRTETAADGTFRLGYLRPGLYAVAVVADANRNGRADAGEATAVAPRPALRADTTDAAPVPFFVATADTTAPEVRGVRAVSPRRLAVRLSEPVVLVPSDSGWTAEDSTTGRTVPLRPYALTAREVGLVADEPLPGATRLRLASPGAAADSAGNALAPFRRPVATGAAPADTLVARVVAWVPTARTDSVRALTPGTWPGARFSVPPDTAALRLTTPAGAVVATRAETDDGVTIRMVPRAPVADGDTLVLAVAGRDSTQTRRYRTLAATETGGIVGTAPGAAGRRIVVEITSVTGGTVRTTTADGDGRFAFERLAPGRYRLRLWDDADGDGRWSAGRLAPYARPEPLTLVPEPVAVRARWDTDVEPDTLALP